MAAKFKVRFTETRTYVHEEVVEADNRNAAIFAVEKKGFEFPDNPANTVNDSDAEEVFDLEAGELDVLRKWVRRVTFFDEDDNGIATVSARFKVRDDNAFMDRVGCVLTRENAKSLICGVVDSFAYPCEGYEKDFDDPDSGFGLEWLYFKDSHTLEIKATIRT